MSIYSLLDYSGFQDRNFARIDEPISLTHSCGHLPWHQMVFAAGPKQPWALKYVLIMQAENQS